MESEVHKQLKTITKTKMEQKGYRVNLEYRVIGRRIDLVAENDEEIVFIEIVHTHDCKPYLPRRSGKKVRFIKIYTLEHFMEPNGIYISVKNLEIDTYHKLLGFKKRGRFYTWADLLEWFVNNKRLYEILVREVVKHAGREIQK